MVFLVNKFVDFQFLGSFITFINSDATKRLTYHVGSSIIVQ